MKFISYELIQLIDDGKLDVLCFILDLAQQKGSADVIIKPEQYLHTENDADDYTVLEIVLNKIIDLEAMGLLTFSLGYDKTIYVRLNENVFRHIVELPLEVLNDFCLLSKGPPERKVYGDVENKIIMFPYLGGCDTGEEQNTGKNI